MFLRMLIVMSREMNRNIRQAVQGRVSRETRVRRGKPIIITRNAEISKRERALYQLGRAMAAESIMHYANLSLSCFPVVRSS